MVGTVLHSFRIFGDPHWIVAQWKKTAYVKLTEECSSPSLVKVIAKVKSSKAEISLHG